MTFIIPRIVPGTDWHPDDLAPGTGKMIYEHQDGHFHTDTAVLTGGGSISVDPLGVLLTIVPTVDPLIVGAVWNDAGTLRISIGT